MKFLLKVLGVVLFFFNMNVAAATIADIDPNVLKKGLYAYKVALSQDKSLKPILTIIDFTKASTTKRLFVINVNDFTVLMNTLVAHGKPSGANYATKFSNVHGSNMTSLGAFKTSNTYYGRNGYSLNLIGLEKKFNGNAYSRRIVIHGADYVSPKYITRLGRLGRSQGCFSLEKHLNRKLIDLIKDGSIIFAYYPDSTYLKYSNFIDNNHSQLEKVKM